jgi:hypothetical protein
MSDAEQLAQQAADRVRDVVSSAERRASEIVRDAEAEAARIRESAEADAADRIEKAKATLRELAGETPGPPAPGPPSDPMPEPAPEPPAPAPDPVPAPTPDPAPPQIVTEPSVNGNDAAARLAAMKLALDGKGRDEIAAQLEAKFGPGDRGALLDDVLSRAGG